MFNLVLQFSQKKLVRKLSFVSRIQGLIWSNLKYKDRFNLIFF